MTLKTSKLRDAIAYALVVGAVGLSGPALAQDTTAQEPAPTAQQEATELDTIVVTGTRIQSQTVTSSSPVTEIQQEEFKFTGATKVEDLINQYPQLSPAFDSFTNNGAIGFPTVNLRNLGPQRTLTLVNGMRLPPGPLQSLTGAGGVSDISIVPQAAIKSVDLLTGGASAVYGSDAIGGVVNFVLDDEFEGVSITAGYSAYQHDNSNDYIQGLMDEAGFEYPTGDSGFDGISRNIDLVFGSSFADGRGHAMGWVTWRENDPLFQGDRDYAACALNGAGTACGGSATNAAGNFYWEQGNFAEGLYGPASQNSDGSFIGAYGAPYNYAPINYYQRPDERYGAGFSIKYEINEHFRPYMDMMFLNKSDSIQIAESGTFFAKLPYLDCTNPLIGSFCSDVGADPSQPIGIYVAKRNVEGGPRITETDNTQWRVVTGLEGDLDENWSYNMSFLHGEVSNTTEGFNDFVTSRIVDAILGCPPDSFGNCVPYDVFTPGGVTEEAAAALAGVSFVKVDTEINNFIGYVTGDTGVALPWVDENISLVMGAEWRETRFDFNADTISQEGDFAGAGGPLLPVSGKTEVAEVFLESSVPLLRNTGVVKSMDLDLGYRHSDYDLSGGANTWKVGLGTNFADKVRLRAGFNHAIRAPGVSDLFSPTQIGLFAGSDPCAGSSPSATPEQCVAAGVPLNRYGSIAANPAAQYNQLTGGLDTLVPEEADTFTIGVVYTPTNDLQFNADYFDIKIENAIKDIEAQNILNACVASGDPFVCDKIHRSAAGDLFRGSNPATSGYVENIIGNFGELHVRGIDLGAMYRFDLGPGRLTTSINGTYTLEEENNPVPGIFDEATYDCAGVINTACQTPKWRHIANARYALDRYTFNLRWRYYGQMDWENTDGSTPSWDEDILLNEDGGIDDFHYIDLSATMLLGEYAEVTLGVNNIEDREPPMIGGNSAPGNANAPVGYDQAGRYIFGSVTFRF